MDSNLSTSIIVREKVEGIQGPYWIEPCPSGFKQCYAVRTIKTRQEKILL